MSRQRKQDSLFSITKDKVFKRVFSRPELAQKLIELVLDVEIDYVEVIETQKELGDVGDSRGVALDVYVKSPDKHMFSVEMQASRAVGLLKRARFYQSALDTENFERGQAFWELPQSYVIFICAFDPFQQRLSRYTFTDVCLETGKTPQQMGLRPDKRGDIGTARTMVFLNALQPHTENAELDAFLEYVSKGSIGTDKTWDFVRQVETCREELEADSALRGLLMTDEQRLIETKWEGFEEGLEQGLQQGVEQGLEQGTFAVLAQQLEDQLIDLDTAASYANLTPDEFRAKAGELGIAIGLTAH